MTAPSSEIILNAEQQRALEEILGARMRGESHLLTGYAGSGKTTLMQALARELIRCGLSVVLTAPTHKAVAVLARKCEQAGVEVNCLTIHSLLSLAPKHQADRLIFERKRNAKPVTAEVVVVDECSMVGTDLMKHIHRFLPNSFVVFVGDPAQLPPVGEKQSESFSVMSRSHLDTIVRQAAENPILQAAHTIRQSQGGAIDWSWARRATNPPLGVFLPRAADEWMRKGFLSPEFAADPDTFRYLCWTNDRVASINQKVRRWIYGGDTPTPFMPGECALVRSPVMAEDGETLLLSTNEEVTILTIEASQFRHHLRGCQGVDSWTAVVPSWSLTVVRADAQKVDVHIPRDQRAYQAVLDRIVDEAGVWRDRWGEFHAVKQQIGNLHPIYALTVHNSQGSTFRNAFVDIPDIRRRASTDLLEMQKLFYVAATRPTHALVLVGAE